MKKVFFIINLFFIILLISNSCYAFDPNSITQPKIDESLAEKLGGVIGMIQIVGGAVAVIAVVYLGIRYMISSTEEKADIKKKLVPFLIGTVVFFGATGILRLIGTIASWL